MNYNMGYQPFYSHPMEMGHGQHRLDYRSHAHPRSQVELFDTAFTSALSGQHAQHPVSAFMQQFNV